MPIQTGAVMSKVKQAWLQVDPSWLAGLWNLKATGIVRVEVGKILVGVEGPQIQHTGDIVTGHLANAIVPTGLGLIQSAGSPVVSDT